MIYNKQTESNWYKYTIKSWADFIQIFDQWNHALYRLENLEKDIYELIDGKNDISAIEKNLEEKYAWFNKADLNDFIENLKSRSLIY